MEEQQELPQGWVWTRVGEIATTSSGGTPSRSNPSYFTGNIPWIKSGELGDGYVVEHDEFINEEALVNSSAKLFPKGTLLIALYGATVGKVGILTMDAATNQAVCGIFLPPWIELKYAFNYFFSIRRDLIELGKGGAQPNISQDIVRNTLFPLPPLPEQRRIVAKLEELFSKLDAGVAAVRRTQALLKRYRQSVLHAAVTGELTRAWREAQVSLGRDESQLVWKETTIGDVTHNLDNKRKPVSKKIRAEGDGTYPYYGANGQTGSIDDFIFDEDLVLVVEDETFVGRIKPFCYKISGKTWVNNHAHVLKAKESLTTDYLNYSLSYYPFTPLTTGSTGRKKLTKAALTGAPYQLPSLDEQHKIVAEVERCISVIDALELTLDDELKRAERLRQSILHRAFTGRLVPQVATDEPAATLLARLRETPAAPAKTKAGRGRKTVAQQTTLGL